MSLDELSKRVKGGATALGNLGAQAIGELVTASLKGSDVPGFIAGPVGAVTEEAAKEVNRVGLDLSEALIKRSVSDTRRGAKALRGVGNSLIRTIDPSHLVKRECGARCQALKQLGRNVDKALKIEKKRFAQLKKIRIVKRRKR